MAEAAEKPQMYLPWKQILRLHPVPDVDDRGKKYFLKDLGPGGNFGRQRDPPKTGRVCDYGRFISSR
jgi:hypothetical protein